MGNAEQQSSLYKVNEIFYSYQAEGYWSGTPAVFIRFAECNLRCEFCDTEFLTGIDMSVSEIMANIREYDSKFVILTGGEPLMNDTTELAKALKAENYFIAVETNGSYLTKHTLFDWITISPKNEKLKLKTCNELKIVLGMDEIPETYGIETEHKFISPKNPTHDQPIGTHTADFFSTPVAQYCVRYALKHPEWRLTFQTHKAVGVK